jgi:hypothetical protein
MAYCKNQQAEKTQQQKCIINLGRFTFAILWYVLFLWYNGRSDWMIPVTQKKVINPAINSTISHEPISARVRWLLVNTMLIIRKTVNRISWKSWSPEILSISFIFLNPDKKYSKFP